MSKPLVSNLVQLVGEFSSYVLLHVRERSVTLDHLEGVSGEETGISATTLAVAGNGINDDPGDEPETSWRRCTTTMTRTQSS